MIGEQMELVNVIGGEDHVHHCPRSCDISHVQREALSIVILTCVLLEQRCFPFL
jgi:hypothetical protein